MKVNIFLVLILTVIRDCQAEANSEVVLIAKLIRDTERPSSILATVCWSSYKKIQLYTELANENDTRITTMQFLRSYQTPKNHARSENNVFLTDLNCPNITFYFKMNAVKNNFKSPFRWILTGDNDTVYDEDNDIVPKAITHIDALPDSEVTLIRRVDNGSFSIHKIYKVSTGSVWKTELYGYYNMNHNEFRKAHNSNETTALRRLNLDGYEIAVCYVVTDNDSINHLNDKMNDHIDTITKVNFPTTNHLLDFLNASRKYVFTETWGYKINGSWNGMTGYLIREEVEIGGSPMFFTKERTDIVTYISSPTPTLSKFVFQQPKLSYENNLFLLSFRASVWYSVIGLVILIFLSILAVAFWEWKKNRQNTELCDDSTILRPNFGDVVLLIFGAACQQGTHVELKGSLGRVVMLVCFLSLMFLYTSYAANIVALLQSSSSQIKTLEDLLHSRIKFGVDDTVYNRYYFSTATEPIRKAIYETKVVPRGEKPHFMSMKEGVKNIQKGLFAFHMETGVGYKLVGKYFLESQKCGLKEIEYLQVQQPWLAVRKNTPYLEMFKIGTKRIQEHGLQSRENRLLYVNRPKCSERGSIFVSVTMVDCYPALLVLSYGTITAMILLAIEIIRHRKQKTKNQITIQNNKSFHSITIFERV